MQSVIGSLLVSCGVIAVVVPKWLSSRNSGPNPPSKELPVSYTNSGSGAMATQLKDDDNDKSASSRLASIGGGQTITVSRPANDGCRRD